MFGSTIWLHGKSVSPPLDINMDVAFQNARLLTEMKHAGEGVQAVNRKKNEMVAAAHASRAEESKAKAAAKKAEQDAIAAAKEAEKTKKQNAGLLARYLRAAIRHFKKNLGLKASETT